MTTHILFLGPDDSPLIALLRQDGCVVHTTNESITANDVQGGRFDFLISYRYRHIVQPDVLEAFPPHKRMNLHIALLPWNRGSDPNLWSFVDDTPKGVSIHVMDTRLDAGALLAQCEVEMDEELDTLATSYDKLQQKMVALFEATWPSIKAETCPLKPQQGAGSYHASNDRKQVEHLLTQGWDTPVKQLKGTTA